jgi:hypothetical protein
MTRAVGPTLTPARIPRFIRLCQGRTAGEVSSATGIAISKVRNLINELREKGVEICLR